MTIDQVEKILEHLGADLSDFVITEQCIRGPCIVHGGHNKTSFVYYADTGIWQCYSKNCQDECGVTIEGLVSKIKELNKIDCTKYIEDIIGNKIEQKQIVRKPKKDPVEEHFAQKQFKESCLSKLKNPIRYVEKRGLDPLIVNEMKGGIATTGAMIHRFVLPVRNIDNKIIGFTGRSIIDVEPKWLHYLKKSINLFNVQRAKKYIPTNRSLIVCEGPFDAIKIEMAGYKNVVSILGNKITDGQIAILNKIGLKKIILAIDADEAGINGAQKSRMKLERCLMNVCIVRPFDKYKDFGEMFPEDIYKCIKESL